MTRPTLEQVPDIILELQAKVTELEEKSKYMDDFLSRKLMRVSEVSEMTGLAKQTIYHLVHRNEIPFKKLHGRLLFNRVEIDQWIQKKSS